MIRLASLIQSKDKEMSELGKIVIRKEITTREELEEFNVHLAHNSKIDDHITAVFIFALCQETSSVKDINMEYEFDNTIEVNIL